MMKKIKKSIAFSYLVIVGCHIVNDFFPFGSHGQSSHGNVDVTRHEGTHQTSPATILVSETQTPD